MAITHYLLGAVFISLCFSSIASAQQNSNEQLKSLSYEISKIEKALYQERKKQSSEKKALRKIESRLSETNKEIYKLNKRIQRAENRLAELEKNQLVLEKRKQQQLNLLGKSLENAYRSGQQEQFKLLLNGEDPEQLSRSMAYMDYINDARKQQLEEFYATLEQIDAEKVEAEDLQEELADKKKDLDKQKKKISSQLKDRDKAVSKINKAISNQESDLKNKKREQARLQKLIKDLAAAATRSDIKKFSFNRQTGSCKLPVNGKILNTYKGWKPGGLKWEGIQIQAKQGTDVSSVAPGTVIFADWFGTHGLLLIIDHGNNYMSLYAHNQTLLRSVGDVVTAGDTISTVGNSGGLDKSKLYFEVRKNGSPVNPTSWCK